MFLSRRGSQTQFFSFQTLQSKAKGDTRRLSPEIDIVLVHGCYSPRAHQVEKKLLKTATSIGESLENSRVHVFGFDASKLLRKGKVVLNELVRQMLEDVKSIPGRQRVAILSHNSAAWVTREALVQSQYDGDLEKVPVGLVDFSLPRDVMHNYWKSKENWEAFRDDLLKHLMKGQPKLRSKSGTAQDGLILEGLDFKTIDVTNKEFERFRLSLDSPDDILPILSVCCSERNGVRRTPTDGSHGSNSSTGSDASSGVMFVSMSSEDKDEMIKFLRQVSKTSPASIPTQRASSRRASTSYESASQRPVNTRSTSRGQHHGFYDARSPRSSNIIAPLSRTSEHDFAPMKFSDGVETPRLVVDEPFRRTNSPQPLSSVLQKSTSTKVRRNVEFRDYEDEKIVDAQHAAGKTIVYVSARVKSVSEDVIKESKEMASWCFQNGDLDQASRLYRELIAWCEGQEPQRIDRGYYRMQLQVGRICHIRGDYKSSEDKLKALLTEQYKVSPNEPGEAALTSEIAQQLAMSQWKLGNYSNAQDTLENCQEKLSGSSSNDPNFLSTHALVLASAGFFKRAWGLSIKAIDHKSFDLGSPDALLEKDTKSSRRSPCLLNHARISYVIGKLDEADEANREALDDMNSRLGPKHFATLDASCFQAGLLVARSKTSQAADAVHRTLRKMIERLGESHPSTLQSLETLVIVYKSEGRYSDAEETVTYLIRQNERVLGPSHPQTLRSKTLFAEILLACGKWKEAEDMQKGVVSMEEARRTSDIDYPGLFFYKMTLASILRDTGQWNEARGISLRLLVEQLRRFGDEEDVDEAHKIEPLPESEYIHMPTLMRLISSSKAMMEVLHSLPTDLQSLLAHWQPVKIYPSIIQTLHCLALSEQVRDDADLTFARGVLKMVYDIRLCRLGEDHRLTVSVQHDRSVNYRLRGKLQESLEIIEDVVQRRRRSLGADHPDYLSAKHQEAVTLFRLGRWKKAFDEQRRTLKAQEYLLGKQHPDAVLARFTLGGIYHSLNRLKEADDLLDQVIEQQKLRYGEHHPIVLRSRSRHALIQLDRGHFSEAEKEQEIVVQQRKQNLPKGHTLILGARNQFAQIIQAAGRPTEALDIYNRVVDALGSQKESLLGFEVRSNLGSCYFDLKDYQQAENTQREIYKEMMQTQALKEDVGRFIASTFNLALTLKQVSRDRESCELLAEAVYRAELVLGKEHSQTMELESTLCAWRRDEEVQHLGHPHTTNREDLNHIVSLPA